jgi:hypothetical protein
MTLSSAALQFSNGIVFWGGGVRLWHSVPLSLLSGHPVISFQFLPLRGAVVCCPFLEFAVESDSLTVWATERHLSASKFILFGFRFRKSSSPRFFSGGSSSEGPPPGLTVFILFVLIIVTMRDILIGLYLVHVLDYY